MKMSESTVLFGLSLFGLGLVFGVLIPTVAG